MSGGGLIWSLDLKWFCTESCVTEFSSAVPSFVLFGLGPTLTAVTRLLDHSPWRMSHPFSSTYLPTSVYLISLRRQSCGYMSDDRYNLITHLLHSCHANRKDGHHSLVVTNDRHELRHTCSCCIDSSVPYNELGAGTQNLEATRPHCHKSIYWGRPSL